MLKWQMNFPNTYGFNRARFSIKNKQEVKIYNDRKYAYSCGHCGGYWK